MRAVHEQTLIYAADGLEMHGVLYRSDAACSGPGVLVFPEVFGLGDFARERARRLAEMGYAALACDLHGMGTLYSDLTEVRPFIGALWQEPRKIRLRAQAALEALRAQDGVDAGRIAAIGFCFGGTMALELARSGADLAAVVGFHSTLRVADAENKARVTARVLVAVGADDPMIDGEQRAAFEAEMRAGNVDWQMHVYGGTVHSFTNPAADAAGRPDTIRYSPSADARSWQAMRDLFNEVFG